ncbi:MAG: PAS domain S-box protein [Thauera sp.]|nr:PAS domain S-box protein [Thauera sp.]
MIASALALALVLAIRRLKRAQAEQSKSEAHYRRLFQSNPHPMWVYDLETLRFLAVNDAAASHYGYSRDEFLSMTIKDIRPPEDLARLYRNLEALPEDGLDQAGVWRHLKKDGSVIDVEITSHLLEFEGRKSELVLAHDITIRRQAENALRESNERLKKVLKVETVGVMFWDLTTGCMTDANETFLDMMGYSRADVESCSLTWQKLTPPEYVEASLAEIRKFHVSGRVGPYEKEYLRKDGTRQWMVFAGSSLGGDACVEFCVDISARKQAEALVNGQRQVRYCRRSALGRLQGQRAAARAARLLVRTHSRRAPALSRHVRPVLSPARQSAAGASTSHRHGHADRRHCHSPPSGRGGAARERRAFPRHLRTGRRGRCPREPRRPLAAGQPEALRHRRLFPRGPVVEDLS